MVLRTDWSVPLDYFIRIGEVVFLKATSSISPQNRVERVLILDFGSQYTQVIARRIREASVFSEIVPHTISAREVIALRPKGIILSGDPQVCTARRLLKWIGRFFIWGFLFLGSATECSFW